MILLVELLSDIEHALKENDKDTVEAVNLSEADANYLTEALTKYDVRKAAVISRDRSVTYTLHVRNK